MSLPKPIKILDSIKPYIPGQQASFITHNEIKLSSNENPFGPDPKVISKLKTTLEGLHRYPVAKAAQLIKALAEKYHLNENQLIATQGSDEAISIIAKTYLERNDEAIISKHGFLMFALSTQLNYGKVVYADEDELKVNCEDILNKITNKTKLIFIANPNNPTGSYLNEQELRSLLDKVPKKVLVVLDCAYIEYVVASDYMSDFSLADEYNNLICLRTFSKAYGLAGIRLGFAYASKEIITNLNKVKPVFNLAIPTITAGILALESDDHLIKSVEHNTKTKKWFASRLESLGLISYPSEGNFILVEFESSSKAKEAYKVLAENHIYVRQMDAYRLEKCLRITIGLKHELEKLVSVLATIYKKA